MEYEDGATITFNRMIFLLILAIVTGGSAFTGYSIKSETTTVTKAEIKEILQDELRPLETEIYKTNATSAVMAYRIDELTRRITNLER